MAENQNTDNRGAAAKRAVTQFISNEMVANVLMLAGVALFLWGAFILFQHSASMRAIEQADAKAFASKQLLEEQVARMRGLLQNAELHGLVRAGVALAGAGPTEEDVQAFLKERDAEVYLARVTPAPIHEFDPEQDNGTGYIIYEILLDTHLEKNSLLQTLNPGSEEAVVIGAVRIDQEDIPVAYLHVYWSAKELLDNFPLGGLIESFTALQQSVDGRKFENIKFRGDVPLGTFGARRLYIEGSRFYVTLPPEAEVEPLLEQADLLISMILGAILWSVGLILRRRALAPKAAPIQLEPDPPEEEIEEFTEEEVPATVFAEPNRPVQANLLKSDLEENMVTLTPGIFRAYDIRGIVGQTIDTGVARQIGQAVGSMAMERNAVPVAVACDGRLSGPLLKDALTEGLSSTGCSVVDVGAVPTPVLYYAAIENAGGSGIMVTGSHNPPDYNGFKIVVGGDTLYGGAITGLYDRIMSGDLTHGNGEVRKEFVLDKYREKISSDIQLARPLKVVADCGNGIGGVTASSVLRAIGAEVFPLFEEVDGTFPNHHPDPSVRENLKDLVANVRLTKADLGVAFDGDADRLGVVTPEGEIIYADRLMMLFVEDILERNPGATIIYDVKCSNHLARAIEDAGGKPMMYKTGHSLIKAKMKEIETPFSGEMSGHFFIKERWYGFDDGVYAAARLLEILAKSDQSPTEILSALPQSFSTPELNLKMEEGETQPFMEKFVSSASFEGAEISTIDGLRADFEDGWGLVRASNTTPVLVLRFEADSRTVLLRIQDQFREELLKVRDDLEMPF
jgi:phosphomannomutase